MFSPFNGLVYKFRALAATMLLSAPLLAVGQTAPSYTYIHLAGATSGPGSADGTGTAAKFSQPVGISVDPSGNVYVADQFNNVIRKITPAGVVTTFAGAAGQSGAVDGTGAAARFSSPTGVATDQSGNVYVADNANDTIVKITPAGVATTIAGIANTPGSVDGAGNVATFIRPSGLTVDSSGNVFVADTYSDSIREITPAGVVSTFAGTNGTGGYINNTGVLAEFLNPDAIVIDSSGNLYVADAGNYVIRKITPAGVVSTFVGNPGFPGTTDGTGSAALFEIISDLAIDSAGNIYVADSFANTIRKITSAGVVTTVAGIPNQAGSADGAASSATFNEPSALSLDSAGNIYVADAHNDVIRKISSAGVVTTFAGTATPSAGSADGVGANATFSGPNGVGVDSSGNIYVSDFYNYTIRKVTPTGSVSTFAGTPGTKGVTNGTGSAALFSGPGQIAFDSAGNLYVPDSGTHIIRKITPAGVSSTLAGSQYVPGYLNGTGNFAYFNSPQGIAVDSAGNVYVADTSNEEIRKITPGGTVTTLAGSPGMYGTADGTGAAAQFDQPTNLAIDPAGNLYVTDSFSSTIRKVTPAGVVTTVAGTAGTAGEIDGVGTAAQFNQPFGITIDGAGNLYVTDLGSSAVRKITSDGTVTTISGVGPEDIDGTGSVAHVSHPAGIAIDSAGNLYIADTYNNDLRKAINSASGANTVTLSAQPVSLTAAPGYNAVFSTSASGPLPLTFRWQALPAGGSSWVNLTDGSSFSATTTPSLTVLNVSAAMNGEQFRCVISDGSAVSTFTAAATLTVPNIPVVVPDGTARLLNISSRTSVGTGASVQIAGFIISGPSPQTVLIRANGPALQKSGLTSGFLADPTLELHNTDATQSIISTNDNWGDNAAQKSNILAAEATTGAPAWDDGSKDAAIVATLNPGGYTAVVGSKDGSTGIALVEVFPLNVSSSPSKLINISTRSFVGTGANVQIAGFIITGSSPKKVIIRANGPALAKYGVAGSLADPQLELHSSASGQPIIATNDNWDAASQEAAFKTAGIDNWDIGSKDSAIITTLAPGGYTAIVSGVGGTSGIALVEVFDAD